MAEAAGEVTNDEPEFEPEPYSTEEMHDMMTKDKRLFLSMARLAAQRQKANTELERLAMFLYTAIRKNGSVTVGVEDAKQFKENFQDFTLDRKDGQFIMDIRRIKVEAVLPDGIESNKPITQ